MECSFGHCAPANDSPSPAKAPVSSPPCRRRRFAPSPRVPESGRFVMELLCSDHQKPLMRPPESSMWGWLDPIPVSALLRQVDWRDALPGRNTSRNGRAAMRIPNSYPGGGRRRTPAPSLNPACCGRSAPEAGPFCISASFSPLVLRPHTTRLQRQPRPAGAGTHRLSIKRTWHLSARDRSRRTARARRAVCGREPQSSPVESAPGSPPCALQTNG